MASMNALDNIANLPYNWDGYGAKKFSRKLIEKCRSILENLPAAPSISPTGRESIQFEYDFQDKSYLEFEIYENKTTYLWVPQREYSRAVTGMFLESESDQIIQLTSQFINEYMTEENK